MSAPNHAALVNERNDNSWWTSRSELPDTLPLMPVVIYRCSVCGRWSHAKKRPASHKRTIQRTDDVQEPPEGLEAIEEVPGWVSGDGEHSDDGGWIVKCGPFDIYEAKRIA